MNKVILAFIILIGLGTFIRQRLGSEEWIIESQKCTWHFEGKQRQSSLLEYCKIKKQQTEISIQQTQKIDNQTLVPEPDPQQCLRVCFKNLNQQISVKSYQQIYNLTLKQLQVIKNAANQEARRSAQSKRKEQDSKNTSKNFTSIVIVVMLVIIAYKKNNQETKVAYKQYTYMEKVEDDDEEYEAKQIKKKAKKRCNNDDQEYKPNIRYSTDSQQAQRKANKKRNALKNQLKRLA